MPGEPSQPPPLPLTRAELLLNVENTELQLNQIIYPKETNALGMATAGVILKLVDVAASLSAIKHCHSAVVTASMDSMNFIAHAYVWEVVTAHCRITQAWNKSMEIEVTVIAENIRNGQLREVGHGYFVLVSIDQNQRPQAIAPLVLVTHEEKIKAAKAEQRRQLRQSEGQHIKDREHYRILSTESPTVVTKTMNQDDANINGKVFGGNILELVHQAGEKAAQCYTKGPVIAVRQDRMNFENPAGTGDRVKAVALVTRTWGSSLEVQVEISTYPGSGQPRQLIATSFMVFVAQDRQGKPKTIKPYKPKTERQQHRWQQAEARRQTRLASLT